ncbi:unnamed protein product [Taenia asiatica]|uniref:ULP_PROTEASE domain-containing protein n=1 Tax=Taenia asiatica TaxID=60517 RepID=A0A0R3W9F6_TAEAS|nr:unnamed protein product [Taenia asiatica]
MPDDNHDNNNHLLKVEKFDMRDATSPLEAAVVAKIEDPHSNADPVETLNIEMDLALLLEQCFKSTGNSKQNCINIIEAVESSTGDLGSSEEFLKVDDKLNYPDWNKSSEKMIDRIYQADLPEATSIDEQCLITPLCNDHWTLVTPIITEIHEESIPQYFCGFSERATILYATCVFRSQSLASVRTIYITLPRSPQIVFPTKLKSMVEFNRLSVTAPSGTEQSRRWKEGAKKPWILPNKDINENNGCAQLVEADAQARGGSHIKVDQKMVTPANPMPRSGCSFSQEDVTRACKSCSTWGHRKRLEASSNIHLLKADVRMPSLLQNTANNAKRQIRMPEKMKHGRRMYSTPDDTIGETKAE